MTKQRRRTRLTIEVTEADIATAVPKDSGHCAIADAIARQIPGASGVTVDLATIRWSDKAAGKRYTYLTPRTAQVLLLDFDNGDRAACQPFSFVLWEPAQITPLKASNRKRQAAYEVSVNEIRAKEAAGQELTRGEKNRVTNADKRAAARRAKTYGARQVEFVAGKNEDGDPAGTVIVKGGHPIPIGALAHSPGRRRVFGLRAAGATT